MQPVWLFPRFPFPLLGGEREPIGRVTGTVGNLGTVDLQKPENTGLFVRSCFGNRRELGNFWGFGSHGSQTGNRSGNGMLPFFGMPPSLQVHIDTRRPFTLVEACPEPGCRDPEGRPQPNFSLPSGSCPKCKGARERHNAFESMEELQHYLANLPAW